MVAVVFVATDFPITEKVTVSLPAGTVTLLGTVTLGVLLVIATDAPDVPVGT